LLLGKSLVGKRRPPLTTGEAEEDVEPSQADPQRYA
jgi:hypothetical protein